MNNGKTPKSDFAKQKWKTNFPGFQIGLGNILIRTVSVPVCSEPARQVYNSCFVKGIEGLWMLQYCYKC